MLPAFICILLYICMIIFMCICLKLGHISEWLTISYVAGNFLYKSILELDKVLEKLWGNHNFLTITSRITILEVITFPRLWHSKWGWKTDHLVKPYFTSEEEITRFIKATETLMGQEPFHPNYFPHFCLNSLSGTHWLRIALKMFTTFLFI